VPEQTRLAREDRSVAVPDRFHPGSESHVVVEDEAHALRRYGEDGAVGGLAPHEARVSGGQRREDERQRDDGKEERPATHLEDCRYPVCPQVR
jgi:hypothetical protein